MKTIYYNIISLLLIIIAGINCSSDENNLINTGLTPLITDVVHQEKWNNLFEIAYQIEVYVKDPQGASDLSAVYLEVVNNQTNTVIRQDSLFDDGGYGGSGSGDVLAGDGVFSNRFKAGDISDLSGELAFSLRLTAVDKDNHRSQPAVSPLIIGANHRPGISEITAPDSLSAELTGTIFTVTVTDSDGIGDIVQAYFESDNLSKGYTKFEQYLYDNGDLLANGDENAGDGVFSTIISAGFTGGKKGYYDLKFYAKDTYGELNSGSAIHRIYIGNLPPMIVDISTPDTIHIPQDPTAFNYKMISMQVDDAEGLSSIDSVYFYSLKPDMTFANGGKPFMMVDNGRPFNNNSWWVDAGDVKAGDGIYSYALVVMNDFTPGNYRFSFYVRDKAGNLAGPEVREINLIGNIELTQ